MKKNDVYLICLETVTNGNRQNLGVFSSIHKALAFLARSKFPRKKYYCIYKIPMNSALCRQRTMKDVQRNYSYQYLGTSQEAVVLTDKSGIPQKAYLETVHRWPDRKAKVTVKVLKREAIKEKS